MEWLEIPITRADISAWFETARTFAAPRLIETGGQIVLALILYGVARWVTTRIERAFTSRTESLIDDHIVEAVRRVATISIMSWLAWRTTLTWELPGVATVVEALWIVALSIPVADFVAKLLRIVEEEIVPRTETTFDDTALPLLNKFARFFIIIGAAVMALSHIDIDIMPFVAGASVLGVAIGFAAKDSLSNLIAGVLLIMDRPFDVGDRIELWGAPRDTATWGDVIEIGLRATKIRNTDNLIFIIPNNEIMRRDIVNYTASGDNIRLRIPISIAYDADPASAKEIIEAVALATDGVMATPAPQIIIRNFGESAIDLQLRVWVSDGRRRRAIIDEITDVVKTRFHEAGVEIPYTKRDLYIRTMPAEGVPGVTAQPADKTTELRPQGDSDE